MRHLFQNWFFFTALLIFLLSTYLVFPQLKQSLVPETEHFLPFVTHQT